MGGGALFAGLLGLGFGRVGGIDFREGGLGMFDLFSIIDFGFGGGLGGEEWLLTGIGAGGTGGLASSSETFEL